MPTKKNQKVVVLGSTGMLGSTVTRYITEQKPLQVLATARKSTGELFFDVETFLKNPAAFSHLATADYIINCVGIIKPHCHDDNMKQVLNAIKVNAEFPHQLAAAFPKAKILQIATDCVYDGATGLYQEAAVHNATDVYGKTKSLGEVVADNFLNIRCSIIGPEQGTKLSLLEWFLSQAPGSTVSGYTTHLWNGVTTLQFAQLCAEIITRDGFSQLRKVASHHHFIPNSTVTKYELLQIFNDVFDRGLTVQAVSTGVTPINRTLATSHSALAEYVHHQTMHEAVLALKNWM